jgi:hypothetical protein
MYVGFTGTKTARPPTPVFPPDPLILNGPTPLTGVFVMGDFLSDLDPRVALGAVVLALISGTARAFGEVLFGEP